MDQFEIIVPTLFGLESLTARELKWLGYPDTTVEDGRVTFLGDWNAVLRANLWLRTGERVLIKVGSFEAETFDDLFEQTKALPWSRWLPKDAKFPVKGYSLKSTLASVRDCQAIIKKAVAASLEQDYGISWFPEEGALYQIQFAFMKNTVTLMIDTSGEGLHKRGYRRVSNAAPLRETIAAAMVMLSYWKFEYPFADPFCGSGTIPIEAAMFKRNIAPGLSRHFAAQSFSAIPEILWTEAREEAMAKKRDLPLLMQVSDLDPEAVRLAAGNAELAGVSDAVQPVVKNALDFSSELAYGTVITNPPYGERMGNRTECESLYRAFGKTYSKLENWSCYILTSHEQFETLFGKRANKKRKLYNGMLKCNLYQYWGEKPPKKQHLNNIKD